MIELGMTRPSENPMPFPDHVFRYAPALRGRVKSLEDTEMRFGLDRFAELDEQAVEEGWPPGWRMDHDAREANRQSVLEGRMNTDLWVFGYGSLIWDPAMHVAEYRRGVLDGWHRSFCMRLEGGRARHDSPGLMAALDEGGSCDGVVLRIKADLVDQETRFLWNREMFSGSYEPRFMSVETPQGDLEALVFVMDRRNMRYEPNLTEDEAAKMIARAEGNLGSNFDYLRTLVSHLDTLEIDDDALRRLLRLAHAHR